MSSATIRDVEGPHEKCTGRNGDGTTAKRGIPDSFAAAADRVVAVRGGGRAVLRNRPSAPALRAHVAPLAKRGGGARRNLQRRSPPRVTPGAACRAGCGRDRPSRACAGEGAGNVIAGHRRHPYVDRPVRSGNDASRTGFLVASGKTAAANTTPGRPGQAADCKLRSRSATLAMLRVIPSAVGSPKPSTRRRRAGGAVGG
jgi:hypothetical protein